MVIYQCSTKPSLLFKSSSSNSASSATSMFRVYTYREMGKLKTIKCTLYRAKLYYLAQLGSLTHCHKCSFTSECRNILKFGLQVELKIMTLETFTHFQFINYLRQCSEDNVGFMGPRWNRIQFHSNSCLQRKSHIVAYS